MKLRPYQEEALNAIQDSWKGVQNPLIEMATGTGKSIVLSYLTKELCEAFPQYNVLMLVHVRELIAQNAQTLMRVWPSAPLGINSAGLGKRDRSSKILFAGIQSVYKIGDQLGRRDIVIIDEAHLVPREGDGMYRALFTALRRNNPNLRIIGFTATPFRLDSGRLDEGKERLFDEIVYQYDIRRGVEDGYLAPLVGYSTRAIIDTKGIKKIGGEFSARALEERANTDYLVEGAADEIVQTAKDENLKSWLAFCSGVLHSTHVRDALRKRGVRAEMVCGETPLDERDRIIGAFRRGEITCLSNANVLTTGFDVPRVDMIAMLRPTESTGLYVQMLGRGTRLYDGKSRCRVMDFSGNIVRHGPVDSLNLNTSSVGKSTEAKPKPAPMKICPQCMLFNPAAVLHCCECDFEWPKPEVKHMAYSTQAPVMTREIKEEYHQVIGWTYNYYESAKGTHTLRVDYALGKGNYSEFKLIEGLSKGRLMFEYWWKAMRGKSPVPKTIDEAMTRFSELERPLKLSLYKKPDSKYFSVRKYVFADREVSSSLKVTRYEHEPQASIA
jgi:DNA repair protein RadD